MSTVAVTDEALESGLHLLEAGIPLSLLLDLATGPDSRDLYRTETPDLSWVPADGRPAPRLAG